MLRLTKPLKHWGQPDFERVLQNSLEQLNGEKLPLQAALSGASHATYGKRQVMILGVSADTETIRVRAGIFYSGVVAGCNCADDPTPVDEMPEYCEVAVDINRRTAETEITLIND